MNVPNLFGDLPASLPTELVEVLASATNVRIERIVSHGHVSPSDFWYDQPQHEFVVLLQGAASLEFEGGSIDMVPGAFLNIPAHQRHRVAWTDPNQLTIWLAIHYGNDPAPSSDLA